MVDFESAEIGDLAEMGCQSPSPAININIAKLHRRVEELTAKLEGSQMRGVSTSRIYTQFESGEMGMECVQLASTESTPGRARGRRNQGNNGPPVVRKNSTKVTHTETGERHRSRSVDSVMKIGLRASSTW